MPETIPHPHMVPGVTGSPVYDFMGQMFNGRANTRIDSSRVERQREDALEAPASRNFEGGRDASPIRHEPALAPRHTTPRSTIRAWGDRLREFMGVSSSVSPSPPSGENREARLSAESHRQASARATTRYQAQTRRDSAFSQSSDEQRNGNGNLPPSEAAIRPIPYVRFLSASAASSLGANAVPHHVSAAGVDESDYDEMPPLEQVANHPTAWQPLSSGRHIFNAANPTGPINNSDGHATTAVQDSLSHRESVLRLSSGTTSTLPNTAIANPSMPRRERAQRSLAERSAPRYVVSGFDSSS
jgi:hypothetical protein